MRRPWWLMTVLGAALAAVGATGPDGADLDGNRRLLEMWRGDPEHYLRLQRDLAAFHALPPERQERLRRFDRQLHTGDLTTQARLWAVLDRYVSWYEGLPEEKRTQITDAPDEAARLAVIRRLRAEEWLSRLPAKVRDELRQLPPEQQTARVLQWRRDERRQRHEWARINQPREGEVARPTRLADFPVEVQRFVETALLPQLTIEEREKLRKADGRWPELVAVVRELADLHPVLPPLPSGAITRWQELPPGVGPQLRGSGKPPGKPMMKHLGRWPDFALEVTRLVRHEGGKPPPLGASRPAEFPAEVQTFLRERLLPALTPRQRDALHALEGQWPEYPLQILKLAREKRLVVPIMGLPGPLSLWDAARVKLPDVPDRLLYRFARDELTPQDHAEMQLSTDDPMGSREKIKKAWYRKKMDGAKGKQ
ncbi:MAG: hypothetical protein U0736_18085 [Gemmataceae bacterium]